MVKAHSLTSGGGRIAFMWGGRIAFMWGWDNWLHVGVGVIIGDVEQVVKNTRIPDIEYNILWSFILLFIAVCQV